MGNDCISTFKGHFGSSFRFLAFQETGNTICTSLTGQLTRPMIGAAELKMRSLIINNQNQLEEMHYHYKGRKLF
jgi:hypothetical protein